MTERNHLTQTEWDHLQGLLGDGHRIDAYAYVRDITGNSQIAQMVQISSGTGFVGDIAWTANHDIEESVLNDANPNVNYFPRRTGFATPSVTFI